MAGLRTFKHFRYWLKSRMTWLRLPVSAGPLAGLQWCAVTGIRYLRGQHGADEARELAGVLKPGDVFYDIGAHCGYVSLIASRIVGESGRVLAFEPLPLNQRFLRAHVRANRIANVRLLPVAVSDVAGPGFFEIAGGTGRGRIDGASRAGMPVALVQIDELIETDGLPVPQVIKMDVEGAELRALQGASRLLARHRPTLLLSTHGNAVKADCEALLRHHGYQLRYTCERDLVATAPGPAGSPAPTPAGGLLPPGLQPA